jgi:hypothetical protein
MKNLVQTLITNSNNTNYQNNIDYIILGNQFGNNVSKLESSKTNHNNAKYQKDIDYII